MGSRAASEIYRRYCCQCRHEWHHDAAMCFRCDDVVVASRLALLADPLHPHLWTVRRSTHTAAPAAAGLVDQIAARPSSLTDTGYLFPATAAR